MGELDIYHWEWSWDSICIDMLDIICSIEVNTLSQVLWPCHTENIAHYSVLKPLLGFQFGQNHGIRDIRLCVPLTI